MRFTKMHGAGNDYIYVDCFAQPQPTDPGELSRRMSDRHTGVGGDGLILIGPSEVATARMRMFNVDGTEAEMCGNGIRCVGKYLFDHGLTDKHRVTIDTGRGVLSLEMHVDQGKVHRVRVDMGKPVLRAAEVPTTLPGDPPCDVPLEVDGRAFAVTCVSMGNPHAVIFVDDLSNGLVHGFGPLIERDAHFPRRTNVEFCQVLSPTEVNLRVWERGSGETQACGTGACATLVAATLTGRTERRVLAHLLGGDLEIQWADDDHVYMTGPAEEVFEGDYPA